MPHIYTKNVSPQESLAEAEKKHEQVMKTNALEHEITSLEKELDDMRARWKDAMRVRENFNIIIMI